MTNAKFNIEQDDIILIDENDIPEKYQMFIEMIDILTDKFLADQIEQIVEKIYSNFKGYYNDIYSLIGYITHRLHYNRLSPYISIIEKLSKKVGEKPEGSFFDDILYSFLYIDNIVTYHDTVIGNFYVKVLSNAPVSPSDVPYYFQGKTREQILEFIYYGFPKDSLQYIVSTDDVDSLIRIGGFTQTDYELMMEIAADYGSLKCFRYLSCAYNYPITDKTIGNSIYGGSVELMSLCFQECQNLESLVDIAVESLNKNALIFLLNNAPINKYTFENYSIDSPNLYFLLTLIENGVKLKPRTVYKTRFDLCFEVIAEKLLNDNNDIMYVFCRCIERSHFVRVNFLCDNIIDFDYINGSLIYHYFMNILLNLVVTQRLIF